VKPGYCPDGDSLHIDLADAPSVENSDKSEGIVLDYSAAAQVVGLTRIC
jgi:uncharacterized protein YuzE